MPADRRPDVPRIRVRRLNNHPVRTGRRYVLYWMTAARRLAHSFGLDRAVQHALALKCPLLIFEPLRTDYDHASDRFHAFIIEGMRASAAAAADHGVAYYPYVEPAKGAGKGLLAALAADASVVVTDDYPVHFYPRMLRAAARQVDVLLEAVDGNGLLPIRTSEHEFRRAYDFRRFVQRELPEHIVDAPLAEPLSLLGAAPRASVRRDVSSRWPRASRAMLALDEGVLAGLPIDHDVAPVRERPGGTPEARRLLARLLTENLDTYGERRNDLAEGSGASRLSPYLHFGHIGSHEIYDAIRRRERWTPDMFGRAAKGQRAGWWNMSAGAEAFLDQLVTWRELGYHFAQHRPDYGSFDSLPAWAQDTLEIHADDERPHVYTRETFEAGATHDDLWNAAQTELRRTGTVHNYLRMLWGKKILHWSASPQEAARTMVYLNDRYALDGRDPNSYSGIFWVLGRFDRPWGPERPVFGKIRYMTSANTRRKLDVEPYIAAQIGLFR